MTTTIGEATVPAPARKVEPDEALTRYQDDLYGWSLEQAALLKGGRLAELDLINLADEIADVGGQQFDKLERALRVLLRHILKWDHQPGSRSRSWVSTINEQRRRINRVLRKNPSLKSAFDEALADAFEDARDEASGETDIDIDRFPSTCLYTRDEFMERPFTWPADR